MGTAAPAGSRQSRPNSVWLTRVNSPHVQPGEREEENPHDASSQETAPLRDGDPLGPSRASGALVGSSLTGERWVGARGRGDQWARGGPIKVLTAMPQATPAERARGGCFCGGWLCCCRRVLHGDSDATIITPAIPLIAGSSGWRRWTSAWRFRLPGDGRGVDPGECLDGRPVGVRRVFVAAIVVSTLASVGCARVCRCQCWWARVCCKASPAR